MGTLFILWKRANSTLDKENGLWHDYGQADCLLSMAQLLFVSKRASQNEQRQSLTFCCRRWWIVYYPFTLLVFDAAKLSRSDFSSLSSHLPFSLSALLPSWHLSFLHPSPSSNSKPSLNCILASFLFLSICWNVFMYYVSNVDIYNVVNKVLSQSLNRNKQIGQCLYLISIISDYFWTEKRKHCTVWTY